MSLETKYVLPMRRSELLLRRLAATAQPDPSYRCNRVHSVYFDTPDLEAMSEVENGDYYKAKVRLRWYEDQSPDASREPEIAYLECKRKIGRRRDKRRVKISADEGLAVRLPLSDPRWKRYLALLRAEGVELPSAQLEPLLHVSYRRHRFFDPTTGLRLALDDQIRLPRVHVRLSAAAAEVRTLAPWAVFEVKGEQQELPPALRCVYSMGARRSSFSKFGLWRECLREAWGR